MQSHFSNLFKANPFSRKQIFSQYKLPEDPITNQERVPVSKDKKKKDQILIRQLRLFKFNLNSVLEEKNQLINKLKNFEQHIDSVHEFVSGFNQGEKDDNEQIRVRFRELCSGEVSNKLTAYMTPHIEKRLVRDKSVQPLYFLKSMILYRVMLNMGKELKYEADCFRLGTMSNFNQSTTRAKFTKSPEAAEQTINEYIRKILAQSSKAMQSKVRETNNWEEQRFLREDDKIKACWKGLEELFNPKQVEMVHFEMLNVLSEFDRMMEEFVNMLDSHQVKYKKYEGVMDSIELMDRQIREMHHTMSMKQELLKSLSSQEGPQSPTYYDAPNLERLVQRESSEHFSIEKNIKIYHINEKLFANYNTETNLHSYYKLRNDYSVKLAQLEKRMTSWRDQLQVLKDIATLYGRIDALLNRKKLSQPGNNRNNRKFLTSASSSDKEVAALMANLEDTNTRKNHHLQLFKRSLLQHLTNNLQKDSPNLCTNLDHVYSTSNTKDSQILERQHSFFRTLSQIPANAKKDHLIKNKNIIEEYIVLNRNIENDRNVNTERIQRYLWQFEVCEQIARSSLALKNIQLGKSGSEELPLTIHEHLVVLQKKFKVMKPADDSQIQEILAHHIYDYQLMSRLLKSQLWRQYCLDLESNKDKGQQLNQSISFSSSANQRSKNLNELIHFSQKIITKIYLQPIQNILGIFYEALFQADLELSFELCAFEYYFWQTLCESVLTIYEQPNYIIAQDIKAVKSLDPEDFFSVPCLTLMLKHKQIKVKNLQQIVSKILKKHYNKLGNFTQENLLISIVSLTLLITYLNTAYNQLQDTNQKVVVLNKLRRYLTVQLMKIKFDKIYLATMQSNTSLPSREIRICLGLEQYLTLKDPSEKLDLKLEFTENCQNYLDMFEKQTKILTLNVSPVFSSQKTISKLFNLHSFQQWPADLQLIISDSKLSTLFLLPYMRVLRLNLQEVIKLVQSTEKTALKESEGFLIKRIKKENFYIKKKITRFKLLASEGLWQRFEKILEDTLSDIQQHSCINERTDKRKDLQELSSKINKVLLKKNS